MTGKQEILRLLIPCNPEDRQEWISIVDGFACATAGRNPVVFWRHNNGLNLKTLAFFSHKDTEEVYQTPNVDLFIFSGRPSRGQFWFDSSEFSESHLPVPERLFEYERRLAVATDAAGTVVYSDSCSTVYFQRLIRLHAREVGEVAWYIDVKFDSNYFGSETFRVLYLPFDLDKMVNYVFEPLRLEPTYVCSTAEGEGERAGEIINAVYAQYVVTDIWFLERRNPEFSEYYRDVYTMKEWWSRLTKSHHAFARLYERLSTDYPGGWRTMHNPWRGHHKFSS